MTQEGSMFSQSHRTDRQTSACNDNGFRSTRFRDARLSQRSDILAATARARGAVTFSYVADGVLIISGAVAAYH